VSATPLRVLVADDEPLARRRILDLLAREPGVTVAGEAGDGDEAVAEIRRLGPDLVFLDVQMPGKTGVQVVREIGAENMPPTIFVTAYDRFALQAFDLAAVDYLLKPYDDERFAQALARARRGLELAELGRLAGRLRALLDGEAAPASPEPPAGARPPAPRPAEYLERIPVEMRGQVRLVPVDEVDFITSSGPYAELHTAERAWLIRERMNTLEERLDPAHFLRIHRSLIVRLERIDALLRGGGGDYAVRLKSGIKLKVSRTRVEELERRLGVSG
jgi:two-component system LytT family response regulator